MGATPRQPAGPARPPALERLLAATTQALVAAARPPALPGAALEVAATLAARLAMPADPNPGYRPATLPTVAAHLGVAVAAARRAAPALAPVVDALATLAGSLAWYRRPAGTLDPPGFAHGHANAYLVGPDALERRRDVVVGVSLLAPAVRYPDHRHPPSELYLVLSPGQWRQGDGPWHAPGPGGVVFNPANVVHAMRSGDVPLLAVWLLLPAGGSPPAP